MGDRALVVFHSADKSETSPTIYLHWLGSDVPALITELASVMKGREDDVSYTAARFCALACGKHSGNSGVGLYDTQDDILTNAKAYTHGDAGVVLVDAKTFEWTAFGGYLAKSGEAA
ncbi:hypothetical protein V1291_000013 [Nitrobacteraceae bacterium AZCC 1564]